MTDGFRFGTCPVCARKLCRIKNGCVIILCPKCRINIEIVMKDEKVLVKEVSQSS